MKHLSRLFVILLAVCCVMCGCNISETQDVLSTNDTTLSNEESSFFTSEITETEITETESNTENNTESNTESNTEGTTEDKTSDDTSESTTSESTTEKSDTTTEEFGEKPVINEADDPYENISKEDFYKNYSPASDYEDAYFRTQNYLMSGDIVTPDQAPTIAKYQPKYNGLFVKNITPYYTDGGYTYNVVNEYGEVVNKIYYGAAYITLEEVAAYVFAYGDVPANYDANKEAKPKKSPWGEYLRINHNKFSGDTKGYPYEPELPNISGCGGTYQYYEIDIGTTGTDCDPRFTPGLYNNGTEIIRGAARIVYARYDANKNGIIDPYEKHVFYTYNHYNDFQEYLNYEGGWGEMFGNITGGGKISSKKYYNPTPYVKVHCMTAEDMKNISNERYISITYYFIDKRYILNSIV